RLLQAAESAFARTGRHLGTRTPGPTPEPSPVCIRKPAMIHIPVLRWGEPYKSLEADKVVHFSTGETLAEVGRANGGLIERDMRHAKRARDVLREIPIS